MVVKIVAYLNINFSFLICDIDDLGLFEHSGYLLVVLSEHELISFGTLLEFHTVDVVSHLKDSDCHFKWNFGSRYSLSIEHVVDFVTILLDFWVSYHLV